MVRSRRVLIVAVSSLAVGFCIEELPAQSVAVSDSAASAQSDSLPFRRGQWGVEFGVNEGSIGLAVLKFRSPHRAWLLNLTGSASWTEQEGDIDRSSSEFHISARFGPRRYRQLVEDAAAHAGVGLLGTYRRADGTIQSRVWSGGVYAEVGAIYLVTSRLSLGGQVQATVDYQWAQARYPADTPLFIRDRSFNIGLRAPRIVGALYF